MELRPTIAVRVSSSSPGKGLMRERSSPGIRQSSPMGKKLTIKMKNSFIQQNDERFNDIYSSVERMGGIGSSHSQVNLVRGRAKSELESFRIPIKQESSRPRSSSKHNLAPVMAEHNIDLQNLAPIPKVVSIKKPPLKKNYAAKKAAMLMRGMARSTVQSKSSIYCN